MKFPPSYSYCLLVLLAACGASEPTTAAPETLSPPATTDGPDANAGEVAPWSNIAPGVQQRIRHDGSVEQRGSGRAAFQWLAKELRAEQDQLTRKLSAAPEQEGLLRERLQILEQRIHQVDTRIVELELASEDVHSMASIGYGCYQGGTYCHTYAEALLDSPGIVDGYSQASCSGYQVTAYVYVWTSGANSANQYQSQYHYASRYGYGYCQPDESVRVDSYAEVPCGFARAYKYYCNDSY